MKFFKLTTLSIVIVALALGSLLLVSSFSDVAVAEVEGDALPSEYSLRDDYVVLAQHQDGLGFCWNFASTMAVSTTIMKATGEYYDFSELWTGVALNNCLDKQTKFGSGGSISDHYNALKEAGLMLETDLPYVNAYTISGDNAVDYYNFFEKYSSDNLASTIVYDSTTRFTTSNVDAIKKHIYEHGSLYLSFNFDKGFVESDGVFYLPPNQDGTGSHAVSIIGWDDNLERKVYLNGSTTPTIFKGAWMILNSYTEKNGKDGISYVFYEDENISSISGYKYEEDLSKDFYFYDKIESGYAYPTFLKGKYYGDLTPEETLTKQKNIFYDDVNLEYSYTISSGASISKVEIFLGNHNVTKDFNVAVNHSAKRFTIARDSAPYGQYKVLVSYSNGEKDDTYLNNFFVTHGIIGEEIEFDLGSNNLAFNTGLDMEYHSTVDSNKNYVIYTSELSGEVSFLQTHQSVYSEKNTSIPKVTYNIENGKSATTSHTITSNSGYELTYNFIFEYYEDLSLQPVNVYYDLGGGVNNEKNYKKELASPTEKLVLYAPTRPGYTFDGWYLDYGNGSRKVEEKEGVYYVSWDDIHHMGENPTVHNTSYYKKNYLNSNTLFVYARWVEESYHNVTITFNGEGSSQIKETISLRSDDSVRYLLKPNRGWCLSALTINGEAVNEETFLEASKYGLLIRKPTKDIAISATFEHGVYLSFKVGDNIKDAYLVGIKDGVKREFRNGEIIPNDYFENRLIIKDPIVELPTIKDPIITPDITKKDFPLENVEADIKLPAIGPTTPSFPALPSPFFGTTFSLIVETLPDVDGYTYVLEDAVSYVAVEKCKFEKKYAIDSDEEIKEIKVASAYKTRIEPVTISYGVGAYVEDHYISSDITAISGSKLSATFDAGQVVYIFIKKPKDTVAYKYTVPSNFVNVGNEWYRMAICVSANNPNLGMFVVNRATQKYTVTWKNWDGSVIYTEDYRYGEKPVFNNKNAEIKEYPTRPEDDLYTYVFVGWDKELTSVNAKTTYTAKYEAVLKEFTITVEPTENGKVTPDGSNKITPLDKHTYIITPNDGYKVKEVKVNGVSVGAREHYTFENVLENQTISVEFERIKYDVSVIVGENGEATPSLTIEQGGSAKIEFNPNFGYVVKDVKIDGVSLGKIDHYTFVSLDGNHTVEVEYTLDVGLIVGFSVGGGVLIIAICVGIFMLIKIRKQGSITLFKIKSGNKQQKEE